MFEEGRFLSVGVGDGDGHGQGPKLVVGIRLIFLGVGQVEDYAGKIGRKNAYHNDIGKFRRGDH